MVEQLPIGANRLVFLLVLAFGVAAFSARGLQRIALRIGLADLPGGRKQHEGTVPVTGGLAMFAGFDGAVTVELSSAVVFVAIKNGHHNGIGYFLDSGAHSAPGAEPIPLTDLWQRMVSAF